MRRAAALAAAALGIAALPASAAETYIVDPAHTFPGFEVAHLGIATQRGRFDRTTGSITLDPEARSGAIRIEIDATSISTGNPLLDSLLRSEDFFDIAHHPRIRFESAEVEYDGTRPARAPGRLTLLGVTKPVTLAIEKFGCTRKPFLVRTTCGADVVASLSRSSFGMSSYAGFIGDEVRLVIQIEAVKQEEPPPSQPGS